MEPILVTAATELPVSLEEFKLHVVNAADTDNANLDGKLSAATEWLAGEIDRAFITSSWKFPLPAFPCDGGAINIPLGNLQSVGPIKYRTSSGVTYEFSDFVAYPLYTPADPGAIPPVAGDRNSDCRFGCIVPAYGKYWPTETLDVGLPVLVPFTCGWDSAANVPAPIKQAIVIVAEHFRVNPSAVITGRNGTVSAEIELGVRRLTNRYRGSPW